MNAVFLFWFSLAIALFWYVGVYKRLQRMQVRGLAAFRSVQKHVYRCVALVESNIVLNYLGPQTSGVYEEWGALQIAVRKLELCMKESSLDPLVSQSNTELWLAFEETQKAWTQCAEVLRCKTDQSVFTDVQGQWDTVSLRARAAREGLNHILRIYNEAIAQFPVSLFVRLMGYSPACLM